MTRELKTALSDAITEGTGNAFALSSLQPQSGGCINQAYVASDGTSSYFIKLNAASALPMFEAEAAALQELAAADAIRVPRVIRHGLAAGQSYLIMEDLPFGPVQPGSWKAMGQQLAQLHRHSFWQFGWHRDNTIGLTPQSNTWTADWPTFFREQRLRPQFELASDTGYHFQRADELLANVENILAGHSPAASLLHGDLWSGNASFLDNGSPVIYDPASYYGDRETDLAFSEFFGGFPREFYRAYQAEWPLDPGYDRRKPLYNLYHVLNHTNLFGGSYAAQAERMIDELI